MDSKEMAERATHLVYNELVMSYDRGVLAENQRKAKAAIDAAVRAEREACALVLDAGAEGCRAHPDDDGSLEQMCEDFAAAIRARGEDWCASGEGDA